jgi:site-specific recombinase XerD
MPEKSFKMAELVADFLLFCQAKQLSKVTVKWYRSLLGHFSKESPKAFDQQAVVPYISHLQDHCYSEVTVNMHLRAIQAFAHWCME